ncbi:hypothetical protein [Pseudofrankia inefficax]|uniref:Uncharacterized protein n=1 Tax=Pseudofrankia inefficax (strain DSM 45817 / CECT 9037 / DDB 130130 / EuI1c) TaxID=298654 RepID=E3JBR5_PSEI1|nr:hypothetical protein [Pseudofrankia inefficax]ADP81085.1 hypothetical protein FraEuI1c_3062 [Pseudofrankia inefficax]
MLGAIALVVSILSALTAYSIGRRSVDRTAHQTLSELALRLSEAFLEYPELRPYFYDRKELSSDDASANRVLAMAEMMLDACEWVLQGRYKLSKYDRAGWESYARHMLENSPVMRANLAEHSDWHPLVSGLL